MEITYQAVPIPVPITFYLFSAERYYRKMGYLNTKVGISDWKPSHFPSIYQDPNCNIKTE